jgi:hypothetical protein
LADELATARLRYFIGHIMEAGSEPSLFHHLKIRVEGRSYSETDQEIEAPELLTAGRPTNGV